MSAIVTSIRRRWALNHYITQCTGNSISWRQDAVEKASTQQREPSGPRLISWGSDELKTRFGRESQHQAEGVLRPPTDELGIRRVGEKMLDWGTCPREAGPRGPQLSSPGERERNAVMANRVVVNMLQFCSVSNSLSNTTVSNKVRGIFF